MSGELELKLRDRLAKLKRLRLPGGGISDEVRRIEQQLEKMDNGDERDEDEIWRSVEFARHPERPYTLDYIERLIGDWIDCTAIALVWTIPPSSRAWVASPAVRWRSSAIRRVAATLCRE